MIALAFAFLKRHRDAVLIAVAVLVVSNGAWQFGAWKDRTIKAAETRGAERVRFTAVAYTAQYRADSAKYAERLRLARVATEAAERKADIRARSNAATDALYASLRRLSDSAKADSTVKAVEDAARDVAAELDSTKADVRALIATHAVERDASDSTHAHDARQILAQAVVIQAKSDTIAIRTHERDARVKKSTLAKVGGAVVGVVVVAVKLAKN